MWIDIEEMAINTREMPPDNDGRQCDTVGKPTGISGKSPDNVAKLFDSTAEQFVEDKNANCGKIMAFCINLK